MDKEVVVTADVDEEEELLYKVFKFVNLLWLYGLILGETLEEARKISLDQGYHEHAVTCGGEGDLHRQCLSCKKNPGHRQFIPVQDFKTEHLPLGYRDNVICDWIRAEADRTCRLKVEYTSGNRPKYHPIRKHLLYPFSKVRGHFTRSGSGYLLKVDKYTAKDNKNCECDVCKSPVTQEKQKVWRKFIIHTAAHVVYDDDEARRTTCYFGYDTRTTLLSNCFKLTDLRVLVSDDTSDMSVMTYITHDIEIINKLDKMFRHRDDAVKQVRVKLAEYGFNKKTYEATPGPIVIISHPHGQSKHITVGECTDTQTFSETTKYKGEGWETDWVNTSYTYNAHTCPGSSGAPVFRLPEKGKLWQMDPHYHSEGAEGNNNNSVTFTDIFSLTLCSHLQSLAQEYDNKLLSDFKH